MTIRYPGMVEVFLTTHGASDLTTLDLELAAQIDVLANASGRT